jgi:peptidoglycan/xylan/chitin deacetylase (PgdA/CDA1 family)
MLFVMLLVLPSCSKKTENSVSVPILLYHHISDTGDGAMTVTVETFRSHVQALDDAGYTTVTVDDLIRFVNEGSSLPEKPLCITFDDGYLSNYDIAYPMLKEKDMKATIFVVGCSVGSKEHYKDTTFPIIPHFDYAEARDMLESGLISIQSHTYDMHQYGPYESTDHVLRPNMLKNDTESEQEYVQAMTADMDQMNAVFTEHLDCSVRAVAYPKGKYDSLTESVLRSLGVQATLTTEVGVNILSAGQPDCLFGLRRCNVTESMSPEELLQMLAGYVEDNME